MARRKKHKKTHRRRRHSSGMGAIGEGMTHIGGLLAGAVVGKVLATKVLSSVDPKYSALGQVAVGIFLPKVVKNKFVGAMGQGMIVNGGMSALSAFGILSGIGAEDEIGALEYISGSDEISTIAGDEDIMSGSSDIMTIAGVGEDEIGAFEDEMYS